MAEEIKKLNYFDGLFLKEEELQLEQEYHVRMRRLHNRHLHSYGVVYGLDLERLSSVEVQVTAGMALDLFSDPKFGESSSREVILPQSQPVNLETYNANDEVYIYISHAEDAVDVVQDRGGDQPIHLREMAVLGSSTTKPADTGLNLILGKVILDASGEVDANNIVFDEGGENIRILSGFNANNLTTERMTLRTSGAGSGYAFIEGSINQSSETGLNIDSNHTKFSGNVTIEGDLAGRVPLGGVISVFNYGSNLPVDTNAITGEGYMLADGGALPSGTALYDMVTSYNAANDPDLSLNRPNCANDVFIMGASSSGNVGGANSVSATIPQHSHAVDALTVVGTGGIEVSGTTGNVDPNGSDGLATHQHIFYTPFGYLSTAPGWYPNGWHSNGWYETRATDNFDVSHEHTFSASLDLSALDVGGSIGAGQSGDGTMAADAHENRPKYISAVYLIRVN